MHAVEGPADATLTSLKGKKALCGLTPRMGWDLDLFVDTQCKRCLSKVRDMAVKGYLVYESMERDVQ